MSNLDLVIVGSVGLDTIETPKDRREDVLGGSASYACATASYFSKTGMVGVVGSDFPSSYRALYEKFGLDLEGLQVAEGETFRWSGVYEENMDNRRTLSTDLNVFEHFSPNLPSSYVEVPYLFLGNIAPQLQLHVLDQVKKPKFTLVDTMDLWINIAQAALIDVIGKVDMLTLNESEARLLTDKFSLRSAAAALLAMGPDYVLIKRGENGSTLFSKSGGVFIMPAFPVDVVADPTGAGDTFAGGLMGYLAAQPAVSDQTIRQAILHGNIVASFGVEQFSLDRFQHLSADEIAERVAQFTEMIDVKSS